MTLASPRYDLTPLREPRVLRDYQLEARNAVLEAHGRGVLRPVVVKPTGSGKSSTLASVALEYVRRGQRALLLAHRHELLDQLCDSVAVVAGRDDLTGLLVAERNELGPPITVASVQTLSRSNRLNQFQAHLRGSGEDLGLVICDEVHHSSADSYQKIFAELGLFDTTPGAGFTATLSRGDNRKLSDTWDEVVFHRDVRWGVDEGHLVAPRGKSIKMNMDLSNVACTAGDFQDGALGAVIGAHSDDIATAWRVHASDRHTIAFTPSVEAAYTLSESLRNAGARSEVVVGITPTVERERIYESFRSGECNVLVSVAVLTEGFDMPQADCVLMARPTAMHHVYLQAVGRGLRTYPGKEDCLILDIVGASRKFALTTLADFGFKEGEQVTPEGVIIPKPEEEVEVATALGQELEFEDVDLFNLSETVWLHTRRGIRFIPSGKCAVFLWSVGDDMHLVGVMPTDVRNAEAESISRYPMELEEAKFIAEQYARGVGGVLNRRSAAWRKADNPPNEAQLRFARNLRIAGAENMSKSALSDAISKEVGSRALDHWASSMAPA